MNHLCGLSLTAALTPDLQTAGVGLTLGLGGIVGWGVTTEALLRRWADRFSFSHACVEGTVVTTILMLLGSLVGWCQPALAIALTGLLLGAAALLTVRHELMPRSWCWVLVIGLLCLPVVIRLLFFVPRFSDATAIWLYHAKALSCACLFDAPYVTQAAFTGTHPEYPLYFPLLVSYFFTLTDSFRDDFAKLGLAVLLVATLCNMAQSLRRRGCLVTVAAVITVLAVVRHEHSEDQVELCSILFTALVAMAVIDGDDFRLPLYLFALGFCKNEGLAMAVILCLLLVIDRRRLNGTWPRFVLAYVALLGVWLAVASRLPSHHEQYPSRLIDAAAWHDGLSRLPTIVVGTFHIFATPFWPPVFIAAAFVAGACQRRELRLVALWPLLMLAVFIVIYMVTPWGDVIYSTTFARLLSQIFAPAAVVVAVALGTWLSRPWLAIVLLAAMMVGYFPDATRWPWLARDLSQMTNGRTGRAIYQSSPDWSDALRLDSQLPVAGQGAIIHDNDDTFILNYMFFPRRFYTAVPDVVAGTAYRSWPRFESVEDVKASGLPVDFIFDRRQLIWVKK